MALLYVLMWIFFILSLHERMTLHLAQHPKILSLTLFFCRGHPVYKCPEILSEIPEIQPAIPKTPVIREILPKISEIRLGILEIRFENPKIL